MLDCLLSASPQSQQRAAAKRGDTACPAPSIPSPPFNHGMVCGVCLFFFFYLLSSSLSFIEATAPAKTLNFQESWMSLLLFHCDIEKNDDKYHAQYITHSMFVLVSLIIGVPR